ncbi:hypothetical protein [Aliamphritea ceti]|uniref:hypothetical protein n=1 Tax=Aliamphritea ceti TaxID=1524258 RepID=UPI0021C4A208|nr:hypothetical protein [Aliamphritea ceti]
MEILVLIAVLWVMLAFIFRYLKKQRLMKKYGNEDIVRKIMKKMIWQSQSPEQLIDSLGRPMDIDQKVLKTKIKEVWKYHRKGKNRYALKVILENNVVVGWDKK